MPKFYGGEPRFDCQQLLMPHKTLVLDGLWYCLCPSFIPAALGRPGISLVGGRKRFDPCATSAIASPRRCYGSDVTGVDKATNRDIRSLNEKRQNASHTEYQKSQGVAVATHPQTPTSGVPQNLARLPTAKLEMKLEEFSSESPNINSASQILRILVRDRHIRPGVRHYRALILANTDAKRGSPEVLRVLLEEMEENGVPADSGTLHAALQVLAVHPDYLLRHQILQTLRDRWLSLSPAGWHYVVAGLLREHQFELALDHIAQMERKDIVVEDWLHALLIYNLGDFGEHDEVLRLMRLRVDQGFNISVDLWQHVLDVVSAAVHGEATRYVWGHTVQLGYLKPSHGICNNVLIVSARTGDTDLAASVVRFMADSDMTLEVQDYKELVETHITAGSLSAAFEVLCSMDKAGVPLEESTTLPILAYVIREKIRARDSWNVLKRLKGSKHDIPRGCARVVLGLCEHEAQNDPFAVDEGMELYRELYMICPEGADAAIYNTLISMCRRAQNREAAMFAVKEMASLGVVPNGETFECLILMCLDADNFQSAYLYFQDMLERGFSPGEETQAQIRDRCSGASDQYAVQLKYHPKIRGDLIRTKEPGDALVPKERIKKPSVHGTRLHSPRREGWMVPNLSQDERRVLRNERRKNKRRRKAIAETQEEEGWMEYQPGGLEPEIKV